MLCLSRVRCEQVPVLRLCSALAASACAAAMHGNTASAAGSMQEKIDTADAPHAAARCTPTPASAPRRCRS